MVSQTWYRDSKGIIFRVYPFWLTRFCSHYRAVLVKRRERRHGDEKRNYTLGSEGPCEACGCLPGRDEELRGLLAFAGSLVLNRLKKSELTGLMNALRLMDTA